MNSKWCFEKVWLDIDMLPRHKFNELVNCEVIDSRDLKQYKQFDEWICPELVKNVELDLRDLLLISDNFSVKLSGDDLYIYNEV